MKKKHVYYVKDKDTDELYDIADNFYHAHWLKRHFRLSGYRVKIVKEKIDD